MNNDRRRPIRTVDAWTQAPEKSRTFSANNQAEYLAMRERLVQEQIKRIRADTRWCEEDPKTAKLISRSSRSRKLTEDQVREMRRAYPVDRWRLLRIHERRPVVQAMAKKYGIKQESVAQILRMSTWCWVE